MSTHWPGVVYRAPITPRKEAARPADRPKCSKTMTWFPAGALGRRPLQPWPFLSAIDRATAGTARRSDADGFADFRRELHGRCPRGRSRGQCLSLGRPAVARLSRGGRHSWARRPAAMARLGSVGPASQRSGPSSATTIAPTAGRWAGRGQRTSSNHHRQRAHGSSASRAAQPRTEIRATPPPRRATRTARCSLSPAAGPAQGRRIRRPPAGAARDHGQQRTKAPGRHALFRIDRERVEIGPRWRPVCICPIRKASIHHAAIVLAGGGYGHRRSRPARNGTYLNGPPARADCRAARPLLAGGHRYAALRRQPCCRFVHRHGPRRRR